MEKCAPKGQCHPIVSDVRQLDVEATVNDALEGIGVLDLLINNSGIPGRSIGLKNTSGDEAHDLLNTHAIGALRVSRAAIPFLLNAKEPTIVNISSRLGSLTKSANGEFSGKGFSYTYRIAKAAQNMLSVCLAEEFGPKGVAIFALHPGQFVSESSASGAEQTAIDAAVAIAAWVDTHRKVDRVQFIQPNVGEIPW
jgi:NAD(P)-dependent dehydrogenase (short-subunit alcohol dehydrogenase family)